ncbi:hypothetical protein Taro_048167 [Colocasia esculenta]|uniref:Calmodulin-binding protein n=1 Tax=Colocasia esculenta TaxID=4460 RepID=A0A843X789_COLES|nr:hypothetical protein [Colocasia esculenta]
MSSLKRIAAAHEELGGGDEEEDECLFRESKRRRSFLNTVREVMKLQSMQCLFVEMEPFLRRVVQEEVQKGLSRYVFSASSPVFDKIQASAAVRWRLCFKSKLPDTLFTGSRIESEDSTPVKLVIEDSSSGMIITYGPLSSVRIEIVVLDGDFCVDEQEDWTEKEFSDNVVREREGKRPLLTGDLVLTLRGGVGTFGAVTFTDNSSWIRSRKFKLGARILPNNCSEERIQEAISGAFFVKDHRGELYKKHHPPSLHDDVWRLEKIGKDGAFHKRLSENGIRTVQDFLKLLVMDQDQLRSILGAGMSNKIWEATVEHARECRVDNKLYSFYAVENRVLLAFDSIFQIIGAQFDGYEYQPVSDLTSSQTALVNILKQSAYRNQNDMIEIDTLPPAGVLSKQLITIADAPVPGSSSHNLQSLYYSHAALKGFSSGEQITHVGSELQFGQPLHDPGVQVEVQPQFFTSSPPNNSSWDRRAPLALEGRPVEYYAMEPSTSGKRVSTTTSSLRSYCSDVGDYYFPTQGGLSPWDLESRSFSDVDPGEVVPHAHPSPAPGFSVHIPKSKWVKLMAALKCGMFIRRRVAAKRRARFFGYQTLPSTFQL